MLWTRLRLEQLPDCYPRAMEKLDRVRELLPGRTGLERGHMNFDYSCALLDGYSLCKLASERMGSYPIKASQLACAKNSSHKTW